MEEYHIHSFHTIEPIFHHRLADRSDICLFNAAYAKIKDKESRRLEPKPSWLRILGFLGLGSCR